MRETFISRNGILVRAIAEADLVIQDAYLKSASDEFLRNIGFNPDSVRSSVRDYEVFRVSQKPAVRDRVIHSFVFELDGKVIGSSTLKSIKFGESAEIHGHIYDAENRGKGVVSKLMPEYLKFIFDVFELQVLIAEPSASNRAPNEILKKLGAMLTETYVAPATKTLIERTTNRYEISRELVKGMNRE